MRTSAISRINRPPPKELVPADAVLDPGPTLVPSDCRGRQVPPPA
jgi:hypothetical protein